MLFRSAAFDRVPDITGLRHWFEETNSGTGLRAVAARFIDSDEFRDLYGDGLSDSDFIEQLYRNVLDRAPDSEGQAYWEDRMNTEFQRPDVLVEFSESPENKTNVSALFDDGVFTL